MGSLFSRVAGAPTAPEDGTVLTAEIEALPRSTLTPGTPRVELPWPGESRFWPVQVRGGFLARAPPELLHRRRVIHVTW